MDRCFAMALRFTRLVVGCYSVLYRNMKYFFAFKQSFANFTPKIITEFMSIPQKIIDLTALALQDNLENLIKGVKNERAKHLLV